jgi:GNAT superfamily N-acetyltransferase
LEWQKGAYTINTEPARLDITVIHRFLTESYWAEGIARETVARSIAGSLPFGLYHGARQIGFARAITDRTTFAYLADVFVLDAFRGQGLGAWLIETILTHPELQGLRRWMLITRDAHGLYQKAGFTEVAEPARYMEKRLPNPYRREIE